MIKVSKCLKWHIEGEIIEKDIKPVEVNPLYFVDPEEALKIKKNKNGGIWRFNQDTERETNNETEDNGENKKENLSNLQTKGSDNEENESQDLEMEDNIDESNTNINSSLNGVNKNVSYMKYQWQEFTSNCILGLSVVCFGLGVCLTYYNY